MLPPKPFYFLRHGQTDWNVEGRLQGHTDIPLNSTGIAQAHSAALKLQGLPLTRIVTSPLLRALKTAAVTAETIRLPLHVDAQFKERTFGSVEGRLTAEVKAEKGILPEQSISLALPEDAEQWSATMHRARTALAHWLEAFPDDILLFVGHGAFFRAMVEGLTGERMEAANATPYHISPGTLNTWTIREI